MGAFEVADVLQVIDRHLGAVAAAATETEHAVEVTEAVMWLLMLGEHFKVWKELPDEERKRLSGLFHARHQGLHLAIRLSEPTGAFAEYFSESFEVPTWVTHLPPAWSGNEDQEEAYREMLAGRVVVDTLRPLMAALRERFSNVSP